MSVPMAILYASSNMSDVIGAIGVTIAVSKHDDILKILLLFNVDIKMFCMVYEHGLL